MGGRNAKGHFRSLLKRERRIPNSRFGTPIGVIECFSEVPLMTELHRHDQGIAKIVGYLIVREALQEILDSSLAASRPRILGRVGNAGTGEGTQVYNRQARRKGVGVIRPQLEARNITAPGLGPRARRNRAGGSWDTTVGADKAKVGQPAGDTHSVDEGDGPEERLLEGRT